MNEKYQKDLFHLVKSYVGPSTMEALKFLVNRYYEQISQQEGKREEVWATLREVVEENRRKAFFKEASIDNVFSPEHLQLFGQLPAIDFDEIRVNGKRIGPNRLKREEATRVLEHLAVVSRLGRRIMLGYPYWVKDASGNKTLFSTSLPEALMKLAAFFRPPKYRTMFCRHMAETRGEEFVDMEWPEFTPEVNEKGLAFIYELVNDSKDKFHQQKQATDFYNDVCRFYHNSAEKVYVFSTTSGLVIIDEYRGNMELGKNPYRKVYFDQIYKTDIEVHYQLDPRTTIRCLQDSKWRFEENAEHFGRIMRKPNIEITEADFSKASWKKYYTLSSPTIGVNFSTRGKGKKIQHGISVDMWDDPQESVFSDIQKCYMKGAQKEPIKPLGLSLTPKEAEDLAVEVLERWRKQYLKT